MNKWNKLLNLLIFNKLLILLLISVFKSYAIPESSAVMTQSVSTPTNINSSSQVANVKNINESLPKMANLNGIDNNADDLIQLKRKLEIEKAQQEIKKLKNGGNSEAAASHIDKAQTVVTGVAINQDGRKIAWLQFADGGSLTVNIGSRMGKYTVSNINMNGVTLSYVTGKKRPRLHNVVLKRVYYVPEKPQSNQPTTNPFYLPSPVVTGANTASNNEMVPPIVPVK